ncbi:MAG: cell division protein FtsZ [Chitinophagia bacterium]|nr:cell division protein FtsZ [Chitinophagia bacterium]
MIQFDLPKEQSSIIKVIGVGGGGSNAVNYMHSLCIDGVDFVVCNTDAQALALSKVPNKVQLGPSLTQGLGAGANPEIGKQATQESLEEIRRILEVNTKMAFITAGMGGGTGTGGAPIVAKICKELGILTVGIVTTPFSYEGKKRAAYAENGIMELRNQVDTLLVISNDKLRHQFGNLTMSAALSTADNVLATAAKCITDVINATGQINVDFADVCTVMRNGGVAILGSARANGENRAHTAIEHALNSPLLNDNDIKGAKWVLININSRTGDAEFTMDEVETIQQYLLTQAGPDTDVILGLGYDESLGDDISVTIIATGFEQKSPFGETKPVENKSTQEEKIMFTLDIAPKPIAEPVKLIVEEPVVELDEVLEEEKIEEVEIAEMIPTLELVTEEQVVEEKVVEIVSLEEEKPIVIEFDLGATSLTDQISEELIEEPLAVKEPSQDEITAIKEDILERTTGFLVKPAIIYAEEVTEVLPIKAEEPVVEAPAPVVEETIIEEVVSEVEEAPVSIVQSVDEVKEEEDMMQIVYHEEIETVAPSPVAVAEEPVIPIATQVDSPMAAFDEAEAQKLRAAERLYKLRNLSFNFNAADPNNEYDSIPAYVRHNLQVHNTTLASVEKFYSSYSVGTDEQNNTQISTINTFLEGKKPD